MELATAADATAEQTLCRMVTQYQTALLRMCYTMLGDTALAEDAVQETFWKAYRAFSSYRRNCNEKTWLMQIALNTCRDMRRSAWFRRVDRRITPDDLPEPAEPAAQEDIGLTLEVMRLPSRYKEVLLLYYYQNMTMQEIATALNIAQSSVSSRLARARDLLRRALERRPLNG